MPLPKELKALFDDLPDARARREAARQQAQRDREEAERQRQAQVERERAALSNELAVAWDWAQTDGMELANELRKAGILRLQILGPLDPTGAQVPWGPNARVLLINDDGLLEIVRVDDYRELRYPVRTMEDFLSVEPPAFSRAFIEAVRTQRIWARVTEALRAATAPAVEE
jgi:hypothetical protein